MNETIYLLEIWEDDDKNSKDDWSLGYHFITDPQEILERIKKFKKYNPKWHEWKPSIYTVKKIDGLGIHMNAHKESFEGKKTVWQQIEKELKEV